MSIFWYFFVIFFEKDDIVVCFQFFFVKMSSQFGKFGAWYWQNVGRYTRVFSKKLHFLPKNGQKMVYYMVNRILGMSIFWYFLVFLFEKEDIVVYFQIFVCENVLPIWKIWCLILAKCWFFKSGVIRRPKWCYHTYSIIVFGWVTWISLSISHFFAE